MIRGACASAFVPVQYVPAAWDEVSQQLPVTPEFDRFGTNFERTWVGKRNTNPIYAINKWNMIMRDRVLNSLLYTTLQPTIIYIARGFPQQFSWSSVQ